MRVFLKRDLRALLRELSDHIGSLLKMAEKNDGTNDLLKDRPSRSAMKTIELHASTVISCVADC